MCVKNYFVESDSATGRLVGFYAVEAVICLLVAVTSFSVDTWELMAFPYGQIGCLLRWLSFSGTLGNVAAWFLFILISLVPAAVWMVLRHRKMAASVDVFLPVFSLLLFAILYAAVNPSVLFNLTGASTGLTTASALLASFSLTLDSVVILYLVLRLLRYWKKLENRMLIRNLKYFFYLFGFVLVIVIFAQAPASLMEAVENVKEGNTGAFSGAGQNYFAQTWFLLVLRTFADYLPAAAELLLSILAVRLLEAMEEDIYGEKTVKAAELLAHVCRITLVVILGFLVCCNVLNLLFLSGSLQTSLLANIPLFYIGFSMILLLISRNLSSGRELKQDYNLFI